jgi:hypothetical protein
MSKGVKYNLPYLDFISRNQEGRHRVMAASELGQTKVPILFIGDISNLTSNDKEYDLESVINNIKNVRNLWEAMRNEELSVDDLKKYFLTSGLINGKPFDIETLLYELYRYDDINNSITEFIDYIDLPKFFDLLDPHTKKKVKKYTGWLSLPYLSKEFDLSDDELNRLEKNHADILDIEED